MYNYAIIVFFIGAGEILKVKDKSDDDNNTSSMTFHERFLYPLSVWTIWIKDINSVEHNHKYYQ